MTFRLFVILVIFAAVSACGKDSPTSPSVGANVPYSQTDLVVGTGSQANSGNRVTVRYTGWLYDPNAAENKGRQFDTNTAGYTFTVGQGVITGFSQMTTGMRVGGRRRAIIPPNLGYGSQGAPPDIPGNATLVFEVELLNVQ